MRGRKKDQLSMLSLASPDQMVPQRHPLRAVKKLADEALKELQPVFDEMYSDIGRPSIPPEHLLKATLLMSLYGLRSERMFCEQLGYNMLFKWFLEVQIADAPFDQSSFGKNRARMMESDVAARFFAAVVKAAKKRKLLSSEHFSADGTLIESYASMKSVRRKDEDDNNDGDGNGWADFRGKKRSNDTHESKTDSDARLIRKGKGREAKLAFIANALTENRNGLVVGFGVELADGRAERDGALDLLETAVGGNRRVTLGADKNYDTREFVKMCRDLNVVPHVTQNVTNRRSAIDRRTTRHPGYEVSQRKRRRIEQVFGWLKSAANLRKSRYVGRAKTAFFATLAVASYNLLRIARLTAAPT